MHRLSCSLMEMTSGHKGRVTENPVAGAPSWSFILRPHVQVSTEVPLPGVATSHPGLRAVKRMTLLPQVCQSTESLSARHYRGPPTTKGTLGSWTHPF